MTFFILPVDIPESLLASFGPFEVGVLILDLMGEVLRSGSDPGLRIDLSALDRSTFIAPELRRNSIGLEARFFMMLIG